MQNKDYIIHCLPLSPGYNSKGKGFSCKILMSFLGTQLQQSWKASVQFQWDLNTLGTLLRIPDMSLVWLKEKKSKPEEVS